MIQLFDVKAAARALSISHWTVRALARQGKLRPIYIGRLVRFEASELQNFIETAKGHAGNPQKLNQEGVDQ